MPTNKFRNKRMDSLLHGLIQRTIQPYIESLPGLVSVNRVNTTPDLKLATVWLSVVDGNDEQTLKILQKNIYDIQQEINKTLEIKIRPRLSFKIDVGARDAEHINRLLKNLE